MPIVMYNYKYSKGGDTVSRLEDKEKKASIREHNSKTFKNYAIGISVIASAIKVIFYLAGS